jgi:hypothetical protein
MALIVSAPMALVVSAPMALVVSAPMALVVSAPMARIAVVTVAPQLRPGPAFPMGSDDGGRGRGKARLARFVRPSHFHHRCAWIACGEATVCRK